MVERLQTIHFGRTAGLADSGALVGLVGAAASGEKTLVSGSVRFGGPGAGTEEGHATPHDSLPRAGRHWAYSCLVSAAVRSVRVWQVVRRCWKRQLKSDSGSEQTAGQGAVLVEKKKK